MDNMEFDESDINISDFNASNKFIGHNIENFTFILEFNINDYRYIDKTDKFTIEQDIRNPKNYGFIKKRLMLLTLISTVL